MLIENSSTTCYNPFFGMPGNAFFFFLKNRVVRCLWHRSHHQDTLGTFEVAATLGEEALGAQVISMASSPSDVLAVKLMQASHR